MSGKGKTSNSTENEIIIEYQHFSNSHLLLQLLLSWWWWW